MPKNEVNYNKLVKGIQNTIERGDYIKFLKMINKIKNNYSFRRSEEHTSELQSPS